MPIWIYTDGPAIELFNSMEVFFKRKIQSLLLFWSVLLFCGYIITTGKRTHFPTGWFMGCPIEKVML